MPRRRRASQDQERARQIAVAVVPSEVTSNYYHIADLMTGQHHGGEGLQMGPPPCEGGLHIYFNSPMPINLNRVVIQGDLHDVTITAHHPHQRNQQTTIIVCGVEGEVFDTDILRNPIVGVVALDITANERSTIKQLNVYKESSFIERVAHQYTAPEGVHLIEDTITLTDNETLEGPSPSSTPIFPVDRIRPEEINAQESNCHAVRPAVFLSLNNAPIADILDEGSPINFVAGEEERGTIRLVFRYPLLIDRIEIEGRIHHGIDIEVVSINSNERNTVVYSNLNSGEQEGVETDNFQPIFATGIVIALTGAAVIDQVLIRKVIEVKPYSPPETEPRTGHGQRPVLREAPDGNLHHDCDDGATTMDAALRHQLEMVRHHNESLERSLRNPGPPINTIRDALEGPARGIRRVGNSAQESMQRLQRTIQSATENMFVDPISQNVYRRDDYTLDVVEFGAQHLAYDTKTLVGQYIVPTGIVFMFSTTHKPLIRLDPSIGEIPDSWKRNAKISIEVFDAMGYSMKGRIYECRYEDYLNPQSEADNHLRGNNIRACAGDTINIFLTSRNAVLPDGRDFDFEIEGKVRLECYRLINQR